MKMKIKVLLVVLYALALFFIGMSVYADRSAFAGIFSTVVGYGSLGIASIIVLVRAIKKRNKG